jgi:hypothetical protein
MPHAIDRRCLLLLRMQAQNKKEKTKDYNGGNFKLSPT